MDISAAFNSWKLDRISEWLPFDGWFSDEKEGEAVSALPAYSLLEGNKYANGTNQARLMMDGVVLHVDINNSHSHEIFSFMVSLPFDNQRFVYS